MGNEAKATFTRQTPRTFWLTTGGLFILAVALRWIRLDWMSFLLDQAAVCARAASIRSGEFPFTGIVNSMGFHNAPGYVWTLLPVFVFTTSPLVAAGWHGLLSATMVFPLALLGRKYRRDALRWLPAIIAAVMPAWVFAGRDLWAQHLNVALAAWILYALDVAMDAGAPTRRRRFMAASAAALGAWAVSVHYGAAPAFVVVLGALWPFLRQVSRRTVAAIVAPAAIICATMIPSIIDFIYRLSNPLPKPEYAATLESMQTDDLPMWLLLAHSAEVSVFTRSLDAVPRLPDELLPGTVTALFSLDLLLAGLTVLGAGTVVVRVLKNRRGGVPQPGQSRFGELLLVWLLAPAFIASVFLSRINPGYLSASMPAGWLLILLLPGAGASQPPVLIKWATRAISILVLFAGTAASAVMLSAVIRAPGVIPVYETPYVRQRDVAAYIVRRGIDPARIRHLSGPVFGEPYRYIAAHLRSSSSDTPAPTSDEYAIIRDVPLLESTPARRELLEQSGAVLIGPVYVVILPSRGAADIFTQRYFALD